jgi:hypothetical protein
MPSSLVIVIKEKANYISRGRHVVDLRSTEKLPLQHFFSPALLPHDIAGP